MVDAGTTVRILADTVSPAGARLTTLLLRYPRFIHAEVLTHRCFSRNSESSRAVNAVKRAELAVYIPDGMGRDRKGMTAGDDLAGVRLAVARFGWRVGVWGSQLSAWVMRRAGAHKQWANRPLDWCAYVEVVVTGDARAWASFFALRCHEDAQPEMRELAHLCHTAVAHTTPTIGTMHVPFDIGPEYSQGERLDASAGYCAAVSYLSHGKAKVEDAMALAKRLIAAQPPHWSPFEHAAIAVPHRADTVYANFHGWVSNRYLYTETV